MKLEDCQKCDACVSNSNGTDHLCADSPLPKSSLLVLAFGGGDGPKLLAKIANVSRCPREV
jgi:hypothetical protein